MFVIQILAGWFLVSIVASLLIGGFLSISRTEEEIAMNIAMDSNNVAKETRRSA